MDRQKDRRTDGWTDRKTDGHHKNTSTMVITDVNKLSEDDERKRLNELVDLYDYLDRYKTCGLPDLFHKGTSCTRGDKVSLQQKSRIWHRYRKIIKPLVSNLKRRRNKENQQKQMGIALQSLIENLEGKCKIFPNKSYKFLLLLL